LHTFNIIFIVLAIAVIVAWWQIFVKAGEKGWKAIIPIYNWLVMLKIVGRPWWWLILLFIPLVNIVVLFIVFIDLSRSFGHGVGFGIGLVLLSFIFALILGFGSDTYRGPGGVPQTVTPNGF
jgi:hypothetical protein